MMDKVAGRRQVAVTDLGRDEGPPDPPALLDPLPLQEDLLRHPDDEEVVAILKKTVADPAVAAADSAQVQGLVAEMQALSKKITAALGAP